MALSEAMASVPEIRRRRRGAALRRVREANRMSLEAVTDELWWSTSKVSPIELANIAVLPADVSAHQRRPPIGVGVASTPNCAAIELRAPLPEEAPIPVRRSADR